MEERERVRVRILHYFKKGFTAAQACKEIKAKDGRYQILVSNVYYHNKRFRSGNYSLVDKLRSGRPSIYDTKLAAKEILDNPTDVEQESCNARCCSQSIAPRLLRKLDLIPKNPSVIPHVLSKADKKRRVAIFGDLLKKHHRRSFFHSIINCDEKWCLYDNPDQSMQWVKRFQKPHPVERKNIRYSTQERVYLPSSGASMLLSYRK
ncbi:hypothetical protein ANCDUO_06008 [Ancylostoma duodenale]|uniref:Mos1 transposase HTH domain-containing protein n=1 Tax=Ancylostoma duodenale TaxID=51022 RepID=A0A0C2D2T9_9BILA|nr:hypothetical protein ANCDUO_06008 [Ancylostoma duodenale]